MSRGCARKGAALAAVVLLMVAVNATVIVASATGEAASDSAMRRVQTLRAFYAAESGAVISIGEAVAGRAMTAPATIELDAVQRFVLVEFPDLADGGALIVEGKSAGAARRIELLLE